jgi:hypothetical protein
VDNVIEARLRVRAADDADLQALLETYDAMRHDLDTTEGLYAIDRELADQPDMFRLEFSSLRLDRNVQGE